MADKISSQYIPLFYNDIPNNVVSVASDIIDKIESELRQKKMNTWDNLEENLREFKTDEVILSGYKIRNSEFLKSFFKFKGTNADLKYIIKNIGYQLVLYRDGGVTHIEPDGSYKDIPVQEATGTITNPCQLEIQIVFSEDGSGLGEYSSDTVDIIKQILGDRMASCSFLQSVSVKLQFLDKFNYKNIKDDVHFQSIVYDPENPEVPGQPDVNNGGYLDNYFDTTKPKPILYGEDYKYNKGSDIRYGQNNIKILKPLYDEVIITKISHTSLEDSYPKENIKDMVNLPDYSEDIIEKPLEYNNTTIKVVFEDSYNYNILDTILYSPEVFEDKAIKTVKFYRKYGEDKKYGYNQGVKYRYGQKDLISSPTEEVVLKINDKDSKFSINLTDEVSIYSRKKNGVKIKQ